jgi:hypothetical protein
VSDIKRYSIPFDGHPDYPKQLFCMNLDDDGEWVRWEDVKDLIYPPPSIVRDNDDVKARLDSDVVG